MTAEEAKVVLEKYVKCGNAPCPDDKPSCDECELQIMAVEWDEALDTAIEALEKQIPKKPLTEFFVNQSGDIGKQCICGRFVSNHASYCENCGQRIKR